MNDDPLWQHFSPLWTRLIAIDSSNLVVAGGYGLFLKQKWLLESDVKTKVVVPIPRWHDIAPRVTKDVDLVLGLDLIANEEIHGDILHVLEKNGFKVSEKPSGKRWQFTKEISEGKNALLEFHAPMPETGAENLSVTKMRVKHKPSLGDGGVHGRTNPEAIGAELHHSCFDLAGTAISVVNPVTWSVMKLTATYDRWQQSQDRLKDQEDRDFARAQALKHAQDVCRVVAMTTEEENAQADEVVAEISSEGAFSIAGTILNDCFCKEPASVEPTRKNWEDEDFETINSGLQTLFL